MCEIIKANFIILLLACIIVSESNLYYELFCLKVKLNLLAVCSPEIKITAIIKVFSTVIIIIIIRIN